MRSLGFRVALLASALALVSCNTPPIVPVVLAPHAQSEPSLNAPAKSGELAQVEAMLKVGADVNAHDKYGRSPLVIAVQADHKDVAEVLIAHGADVNNIPCIRKSLLCTQSVPDVLPLEVVANKEMADLLIAHGANVNAYDTLGNTPLATARNNEIAELLLAHGADIRARPKPSECSPLGVPVAADRMSVVEVLLAHGVDVNAKCGTGVTPLYNATNRKMAELLIANGADVNAKAKNGSTPLFHASLFNKLDVAECLIAHGAEVNARLDDGRTPLFFSLVLGDHPDMAKLLLAHGADVGAANGNDETPLYLAVLESNRLLVQRLAATDGGTVLSGDALSHNEAATAANQELVNLLIAAGADVNAKNKKGETPLDAARSKDNRDLVHLLVLHGAVAGTRGH